MTPTFPTPGDLWQRLIIAQWVTPNAVEELEHLPPEKMVEDILAKEQRIIETMGEIKVVLAKGHGGASTHRSTTRAVTSADANRLPVMGRTSGQWPKSKELKIHDDK